MSGIWLPTYISHSLMFFLLQFWLQRCTILLLSYNQFNIFIFSNSLCIHFSLWWWSQHVIIIYISLPNEKFVFAWLISRQPPLISRWMCFSNLSNYVTDKQANKQTLSAPKTFITICFQLIVLSCNSVGELLSTSRLHRGCGVSVLGGFQHLVGHRPEQPAPALE